MYWLGYQYTYQDPGSQENPGTGVCVMHMGVGVKSCPYGLMACDNKAELPTIAAENGRNSSAAAGAPSYSLPIALIFGESSPTSVYISLR